MNSKKGFTLIELIVSIVLVSIVMISLLSSLIQLRKTYNTIHENSDILVYSSSIARVINNDLAKNNGIRTITCEADGKSCDMILGNNSKRKIEILENITEDTNYPSEKGKHDNIKTTIKYTNPKIEHDNIIYIRTLELDKYVNKNNDVSTKGYSFLDMIATKTEYYNGSNEDFIDIYTTLTIRVNNGKDEDIETNNILIHAAGRYDFSEYIGKVYSIYLDHNGAKENVIINYIDEMFGVGFFKPESAHNVSSEHLSTINVPKRDGYGFAGYYYNDNVTPTEVLVIDSTGKIVVSNRFFKEGIPFENIGDVTKPRVYAKWEKCEDGYELKDGVCVPKDCNVELLAGDGKTDYNAYVIKYMQNIPTLTAEQLPYRDGHIFNGYYKSSVEYHDKTGRGLVQNKDYNDENDKCISLNAKWEACTAGTFLRAKKDTSCIKCVKGSYNNTDGSSSCTACNDGKTTSAAGQTSCNEDCSNKAHAKTWVKNTWNSDDNSVDKLCVIKSCEDGYHLDKEDVSGNKCLPDVYEVVLDNQSATSAGTTKVWYEYNTTKKIDGKTCYYYTDSSLTKCLKDYTITKPSKTNFVYKGYFTKKSGSGTNYVDTSGKFVNNIYKKLPKEIDSSYSTKITLYASWEPEEIKREKVITCGSGNVYWLMDNGNWAIFDYNIKLDYKFVKKADGKIYGTVNVYGAVLDKNNKEIGKDDALYKSIEGNSNWVQGKITVGSESKEWGGKGAEIKPTVGSWWSFTNKEVGSGDSISITCKSGGDIYDNGKEINSWNYDGSATVSFK